MWWNKHSGCIVQVQASLQDKQSKTITLAKFLLKKEQWLESKSNPIISKINSTPIPFNLTQKDGALMIQQRLNSLASSLSAPEKEIASDSTWHFLKARSLWYICWKDTAKSLWKKPISRIILGLSMDLNKWLPPLISSHDQMHMNHLSN